ncbi:MAG: hypothetical protein Fur0034_21830 [Desulfuromonadia bacterium]
MGGKGGDGLFDDAEIGCPLAVILHTWADLLEEEGVAPKEKVESVGIAA